MNMEDLKASLLQYNSQLSLVNEALQTTKDDNERQSLLSLKSDLNQLIHLTQESLTTLISKENDNIEIDTNEPDQINQNECNKELDDEYALFMQEMVKTGAYDNDGQTKAECSKNNQQETSDESDIEDELATLLGMKCAVLHTHRWGGQPTLHNAMVSAVIPRQDDDQFKDLQVRVLFTHPTHTEMLPCPFYLNGECKFSDEQCRYCHGEVVHLSNLKEAIEPDFESIRIGSTILLKLKWPENEDINLIKKSTEKYHLWHRAVVKNVDLQKRTCTVKLEQGVKTGEKRKSGTDEYNVSFEEIFPLNTEDDADSNDSLSDTEYPESKTVCPDVHDINHTLLVEKSLQNNAPAMGEWERHTRGIGSKLMLAMGYVPGTGLGSGGDGRLQPVEARVLPVGKSLDHCMAISEKAAGQDPLKIEQKLKRLQKKEEERNKRAYEREKEKERRNVFNFLNRTLGDNSNDTEVSTVTSVSVKQSTSKDLNIEQFKITEDTKKIERDILKLNSSIVKYPPESNGYRSISAQIAEKNKELVMLKNREQQIAKEQKQRKDKHKMTVF